MQPLVFFLQPLHGVVEVPAGAGGGGHRGLLHGEQHPVIAVNFGIKLLGIIGQPDVGDIRKTDLPHVPHRIIEQHPVFQLLQVGEFIPDLEGEPAVGALDIAGGHGEILRHKKLRNGGLGQDAVQPGGLVGGVPLLTELLLCFIESLLRLLQLHRSQNKLLRKLQLAGLQLGLRLIQLRKGGVQLLLAGLGGRQLLFQLRNSRLQGGNGGVQLGDGAVVILHLVVALYPLFPVFLPQNLLDGGGVLVQGLGALGKGLFGFGLGCGRLPVGFQSCLGTGHAVLGGGQGFIGLDRFWVIAVDIGGFFRFDGGKGGLGGIQLCLQFGIIRVLLQLLLQILDLGLLIGLPLLQFLPAGILLLLQPLRGAQCGGIIGVLGGFQLRFGGVQLLLQGVLITAAQLLQGGVGSLQAVFGGLQIGAQGGAVGLQKLQLGVVCRTERPGDGLGVIVVLLQLYHGIVLVQYGL